MAAVPLTRHRDTRVVAGVCAGLAEHLGVPVTWVRVGMVVFALFAGAGVLFYLWLWVTVPWDGAPAVQPLKRALTKPADVSTPAPAGPSTPASAPAERVRWPVAELLLGAGLLVAENGHGAVCRRAALGCRSRHYLVTSGPCRRHPAPGS